MDKGESSIKSDLSGMKPSTIIWIRSPEFNQDWWVFYVRNVTQPSAYISSRNPNRRPSKQFILERLLTGPTGVEFFYDSNSNISIHQEDLEEYGVQEIDIPILRLISKVTFPTATNSRTLERLYLEYDKEHPDE